MALIVETGSGLSNADALVSVADADTYCTAMGVAWTGDTTAKEQAIRRATAVLNGMSWQGLRVNGRNQSLAWPRYGVSDLEGYPVEFDAIPVKLKSACIELAARELANPGVLTPDVTPGAAVKRERVDVLEVEYANPATTVSSARMVVSVIEPLIKEFLAGAASSSSIVGSTART